MMFIDPLIRAEMVQLRKSGTALTSISESTGINVVYVADVLKEELEEQYDNYKLTKPRRKLSEQEKKRIVELRKSYYTLKEICQRVGAQQNQVVEILKEKLKDEYPKYSLSNWYRKFQEGEYDFPTYLSRHPLIKEQLRRQFKDWYYKFCSKMNMSSSEQLENLMSDAIEIFFSIAEETLFKHNFQCINIPVFVYAFLRARSINVTFSHLLELSGMTKHECFKTLRIIRNKFPEYLNRDRKQVVLGKIHEVVIHFQLSLTFFENARKILQKLWKILHITTDGVIAGTVAILSFISINCETRTISDVCKKIGASQSAVIFQIKNKVLKNLGISGFTTLTRSKELIRNELLEKFIGLELITEFF